MEKEQRLVGQIGTISSAKKRKQIKMGMKSIIAKIMFGRWKMTQWNVFKGAKWWDKGWQSKKLPVSLGQPTFRYLGDNCVHVLTNPSKLLPYHLVKPLPDYIMITNIFPHHLLTVINEQHYQNQHWFLCQVLAKHTISGLAMITISPSYPTSSSQWSIDHYQHHRRHQVTWLWSLLSSSSSPRWPSSRPS